MTLYLVGGGVDTVSTPGLLHPFTRDLEELGRSGARVPRLAVVLDDQWGRGEEFLPEYVEALDCGAAEIEPVFLRPGHPATPQTFADVDGIVVGGGPTPAYCEGLREARDLVRHVVSQGVPYVGFSAGAMVASRAVLVGGWRLEGRDVCPEEWSGGLEQVTLRPGLGLVPFTVDVHAAQAGLLGRAVSLVDSGQAD